ncbi:Iron-sulfur assembly protein 2 [Candida viswanathii]|uniref:Iron-sulfur assembly protein 2 n=1 Tax=Candida viswanathii TaxID=5486 RepID=A0A367XUP1_9ASCO|nr:Iron-sulfur assembly protein 2 [Candida viswanathii]
MRVPKGIAYPIIHLTPIRLNATKVLKPSSFSFPTTPPPPPQQQQQQQQEDEKQPRNTLVGDFGDDFKVTRLVQGETDLKLGITQRASDKLNQIKRDEGNNDAALAIKVESGGCHGFQYNLKLIDVSKDAGAEEFIFERDGGKVVLDEPSLMILQDSKVDYTKELIGSQFKIVDSPYTSSSCGCGSSFDFDFDKLEEKSK